MVKDAVVKEKITADEYKDITGEDGGLDLVITTQ